MSEVAGPRLALERALTALGLDWDAWPEVLADPRLDADTRLSAVLVLLAEEESRPAPESVVVIGEDHQDRWGRSTDPWPSLSLARLPWTAATATIALRSVTRSLVYEERCLAIALRGAKQVCDEGLADASLLDALTACRARLDDDDGGWRHRIEELRALAHRAAATAAPPELLDLSPLVDGDGWAEPARAAAQEQPGDEIASLVRLLVDLGPRKPPRKWLREIATALEPVAARTLLGQWLALAAVTDVVLEWPGSSLSHCRGTLFVGTNTDLVRAAVWATSVLPDEAWPVEPLGALARRGAAPNGAPRFPEALSLKVASAAVDVLGARGGPADRDELAALLEDLRRRDLVKRVGAALHRTDEASAREEELRRTKAQDVRRRAAPAPRKARAAFESQIRHELGPTLRSVGFTGGPRVWRRARPDRVDVIGTTGHRDAETGTPTVRLWLGTRLDAAHPADDPRQVDHAQVGDGALDVLLHDREQVLDCAGVADPSAPVMTVVAERIRDVLAPFLDALRDDAVLRDLLERDEGVPSGAFVFARQGSPARVEVLGMLALARGERSHAVAHLKSRLDSAVRWLEDHPDDIALAQVDFWTRQLRRAHDLPG